MFHWWSAFWRAHLDNVLEDIGTKTLRYLYDFGDCWEHTIKVERILEPELGVLYPRLIDATGRCPPIGAPWGYAELRSTSPSTNVMPKSKSGLPTISIQTSWMPTGSPKKLPR